jgi:hypothetical protein
MRRMQVCGHVPTPAVLFDHHPIEAPHDVRFPRLNQHVGGSAGACGQIAVAITPLRPGDQFPAAGFLQASTARALEHLGARILGDHPLHLGQPCALGGVATRILQKDHGRVACGERLDQEPLMGIMARQPVW